MLNAYHIFNPRAFSVLQVVFEILEGGTHFGMLDKPIRFFIMTPVMGNGADPNITCRGEAMIALHGLNDNACEKFGVSEGRMPAIGGTSYL